MKNEIQFDMRSGDSDAVSRQRPQRQGWRAPPLIKQLTEAAMKAELDELEAKWGANIPWSSPPSATSGPP